MNPLEKLMDKKKQYEELLKKEGEQAFRQFLKDWFHKNPDVYGVKWAQYTPFFNDGDPCEFGLHGVSAFKTKEAFDEARSTYDEGGEEIYGKGTLEETLESVEDVLKAAFGDHAIVSANREAITVDEYDHD